MAIPYDYALCFLRSSEYLWLRTISANTRGDAAVLASLSEIQPVQTAPHLRILQAVFPAEHLCACHLNLGSSHYCGLPVVSFAFWATLLIGFLHPPQTTAQTLDKRYGFH